MHGNVTGALGRYLDDVQSARVQSAVQRLAKLIPGGHALKAAAVHFHDRAKIQAGGRAEKLLEVLWVCSLGQEGEDAPAIVVDQDNDQVQTVQARCEQAVEIGKEREIADYQYCLFLRTAPRAGPQCAGDHAIDAVSSAITQTAYEPILLPEEGIHVAHGHAIADVEQCIHWQKLRQFGEDAALEEVGKIRDSGDKRATCGLFG